MDTDTGLQDPMDYDGQSQHSSEPWYALPSKQPPFTLLRKISSQNPNAPAFSSLAIFPWEENSLDVLWRGSWNSEDAQTKWKVTLEALRDAVAVGGERAVYVFYTHQRRPPLCVKIPPPATEVPPTPEDQINVAWALCPNAIDEPLLVFSVGNILYTFNVRKGAMSSYLRGHGGYITSIAVHPIYPQLICTTSRDYTARIYDLTQKPQLGLTKHPPTNRTGSPKTSQEPETPHWPPGSFPSRAGAAHGLHMAEDEGNGIGRCIIVLVGGRSGGHEADVLNAAFHPDLPLIATCGLDRAVKIWVVRDGSSTKLRREDKPIFSTTRLHNSRVLSVSWLSPDLLVTHCAAVTNRVGGARITNKASIVFEPGDVVIWRWLSLDRFFTSDFFHYEDDREKRLEILYNLSGSASDFRDSSSFKVISRHKFQNVDSPFSINRLTVFSSSSHDPMILYIEPSVPHQIHLCNLAHFKPRELPVLQRPGSSNNPHDQRNVLKKLRFRKTAPNPGSRNDGNTSSSRDEAGNGRSTGSGFDENSQDGNDSDDDDDDGHDGYDDSTSMTDNQLLSHLRGLHTEKPRLPIESRVLEVQCPVVPSDTPPVGLRSSIGGSSSSSSSALGPTPHLGSLSEADVRGQSQVGVTPKGAGVVEDLPRFRACAMGMGGNVIVAVGERGCVYVWSLNGSETDAGAPKEEEEESEEDVGMGLRKEEEEEEEEGPVEEL